ncbi:MAG TPA: hypothetical protein DET40_09120 [Lentisphaeria bacterium]|nr:MAG: hypothetical protein A2X45_07910 [Lentisphaerae bacterium GWF2_50_93]HCE43697.1 hypothetical protein [Lentisphaeria bacterium]
MSINVTSYNQSGPRRRKSRHSDVSRLQIFATTLKISIPFCILFTAAIIRVMWTSQAETINKESVSLEGRISDIDRETANLNIMIEQQSGKNILSQVKKYNLDLHYPLAGQIKKFDLKEKIVQKPETPLRKPVAKQSANTKPMVVTQRNPPKNEAPAKYYR